MLFDVHPTLLDALIKVTLVLAFGCALNLALWRAAAATRHLIWLLTLSAALALPILCAALPGWHVLPARNLPVAIAAKGQANSADVRPLFAPPAIPRADLSRARDPMTLRERSDAAARAETSLGSTNNAHPTAPMSNFPRIDFVLTSIGLAIIWSAGGLFLLSRIVASWIALRRLARRSIGHPDDHLSRLLADSCGSLNLHHPVRLLLSDDRAMPMTWGVLRPIILLPADALNWPASRLRPVLLHELAHIKRHDALAQLLAQIACAVYWFHPLAWLAAHGMTREQERSADDLVLAAHEPPADYASLLLELAAGASSATYSGAINMARPIALESRLRAVLDPMRRRGGLSTVGIVTGALVAFTLITPLAALRARAQTAADQKAMPQAKVATYSGHVVAADGSPVTGAEVVINEDRVGVSPNIYATRSAADGSFSLSDVAVKPDASTTRRVINARAPKLGASAAWGDVGDDARIAFSPQSTLQVKLVGPDGRPVSGLRPRPISSWLAGADSVSLQYPLAWSRELTQQTDAAGVCTFVLPRESRTLFAIEDPRFAQLPLSSRARASAVETSEPVTIQLKPASTLSGKITYGPTGQPAAGIRVLALDSSNRGDGRGETVTDERGEFHMIQLGVGDYDVKLSWPRPQWTAVPLLRVRVAEGQDVKDKNLVLIHGGIITGRVYRGDTGEGVQGVGVDARDATLRQIDDFSQTDSDGRFSLRVPPGTNRVFINSPSIEGYGGFGDQNAQDVTVAEGQTVTHDFKLTRTSGKPVTGKVIDADGKPLPGVRVTAEAPDAGLQSGFSSSVTDAQGNFRFVAVEPGTSLRAAHRSLELAREVSVDGGEIDVTLQLVPKVRITVTGMVVDPNNLPIVDARIQLISAMGSMGLGTPDAAATDALGHFTLRGLSPTVRYSISVSAAGYGVTAAPIEFKPGVAQLDIGMIHLDPATALIAGRVVDALGHPVPKVKVNINGTRTGPQDTQTDEQGRFSFRVVEGASVLVYLRDAQGTPGKATRARAGKVDIELSLESAIQGPKPGQ
ncbi:MAG TPA: carboxypeptidase regulatory-like domain-containing protein [Humisphaera sp.]|jgi:beta-lactamase regulating signal transducer with metallopeptidase domain/protocatechuate 3,4-dioxygenase beta subunit|nr:carboxypeptidase regulatory-like domain-containing protein [Humisphaera sp.]